jgi:hypothetical protein
MYPSLESGSTPGQGRARAHPYQLGNARLAEASRAMVEADSLMPGHDCIRFRSGSLDRPLCRTISRRRKKNYTVDLIIAIRQERLRDARMACTIFLCLLNSVVWRPIIIAAVLVSTRRNPKQNKLAFTLRSADKAIATPSGHPQELFTLHGYMDARLRHFLLTR